MVGNIQKLCNPLESQVKNTTQPAQICILGTKGINKKLEKVTFDSKNIMM